VADWLGQTPHLSNMGDGLAFPMWSDDGNFWWNGSEWIAAAQAPPEAGAPPGASAGEPAAETVAAPAESAMNEPAVEVAPAADPMAGAVGAVGAAAPVVAAVGRNQMFETTNQLECKERLRGIFKIGQQYDIFLPGVEAPAGYCHRGFNWPFAACDLKIYTDTTMAQELLHIKQNNGFDAWGSFDLYDSANGQHVCNFTRKFWAGILQRKWIVSTPEGQELLMIQEDSLLKSLLRRFGGGFFPPIALILRTNLNFRSLDGTTDFGAFNRKFSLRDRYEINRTSPDLDGRILWAVGPLLDNAGGR
jgi:hypothetical protein